MQHWASTLEWIHADSTRLQVAVLVQDAYLQWLQQPERARAQLLPQMHWAAGQPVAASYFKMLGGNVATLGGIRASEGWDSVAVNLLVRQITQLQQLGVRQIQAVVHEQQAPIAHLLAAAGLESLTHVSHQWLDIESVPSDWPIDSRSVNSSAIVWRPAHDFSRLRLVRWLEGTLQQTLDCPALNGLRDASQVLDGFLEGRTFRQVNELWEVLEYRGDIAGCLLLQEHNHGLLEIAYLGLLPAARGLRLGRQLVERAIRRAHQRSQQSVVAAVDEQNWPALNLYRQYGFQQQQRFEFWLWPGH
jgi:ribosomal protein S18 acetylase RimI-like enzyme